MRGTRLTFVAVAAAAVISLVACTGSSTPAPNGQIQGREISWLISRPADASVINVVKGLAADYAATHPGFSLNLITTPDRPSYLQKFETLAAADQLPELFDTDATPFTKKLVNQGKLVNVEKVLKDLGLYDKYRSLALDYQRFDDGSLYMVPFEFEMEFFWYNKALFAAGAVDSYPKSAYAYEAGQELTTRFGFKKLPVRDPYSAPVGAVLVYGGRGHVEIRTKHGFVSDYHSNTACFFPLLAVYGKF